MKRIFLAAILSSTALFYIACDTDEAEQDEATAADTTATVSAPSEDLDVDLGLDTIPELEIDTTMVAKSEQAAGKMKIGYVNSTQILLESPDIKRADAELQKFAQTLENQLKQQQQELQNKYVKYMQDTAATETVMRMRQEELQGMQQRIYELQYSSEQELQQRKEKLYQPIINKINKSINRIAEQYGYTHVLDSQSLLFVEDSYDLTPLVKRQLGM